MRLAETLKRAGKTKEADQALEAALAANPGDAGLWRQAAEARKRAGQGAKALEALERAALLAPEDQELCERLAAEYLAAGREARAAAQYEKLIALRPRDASLLVKLAGVYQDMGDKDALKRTYRRLARLKPNDPDLQYNLAVIALDQKDYQEALKRLDAAARNRPDDPEINDARLDALLNLGKWDAAAKLAGRMADLSADSRKLLRRLYPSLSKHRPKLMAGLLERALRKNPKQAGLYEMAADLCLDRDDPAGAAEALRRGVEALPDNTRLMFTLAQVYEAQGRDKEALDVLARLLDRDPDHPGAGERYLQLKTRDLSRKPDKAGKPDK
jgi:tetratricopeptide (TPR) repeat protein